MIRFAFNMHMHVHVHVLRFERDTKKPHEALRAHPPSGRAGRWRVVRAWCLLRSVDEGGAPLAAMDWWPIFPQPCCCCCCCPMPMCLSSISVA